MSDAWKGLDLGLDASPTDFTGYETLEDEARVLATVVAGEVSGECYAGQEATIVLDKAPFYAEMGGQCADKGSIVCDDGIFDVSDVHKIKDGKHLHIGTVREGSTSLDSRVKTSVDIDRRKAIMRAHSATYLLHKAF